MPVYRFIIDDLQVGACGVTALVLICDASAARLHVRVTPLEAQALSAELARLPTGRTRIAGLVGQLLQHADARDVEVQLSRGAGNMVEATLVASFGASPLALPLAFADAVMIARVAGLSLVGDVSLEPLLRAQLAAEPELTLPAAITAFLSRLPDLSA